MQDGISKISKRPFKLRTALNGQTEFLVSTTLPVAKHIHKLRELVSDVRDEIAWCLTMVYSHVIYGGASGQGKVHFFHHVAGTALYESHHGQLIKDKNHGLKAGTLLRKLTKTIKKINNDLFDKKKNNSAHREILTDFKAELTAHYNTLVKAIKRLPEEAQAHLRKHQNLKPEELEPIQLSAEEEGRISKLHPKPSQLTPKKLTKDAHASRRALQTTKPPVKFQHNQADIVFTQLSSGLTFSPPAQKPSAKRKLLIEDESAENEIDAIFAPLNQKSKLKQ